MLFHDPSGALGAKDPPVHRVIRIPLDIAQRTISQMNPNPTPASAHVAGRLFDLVRYFGGCVDRWLAHKYLLRKFGSVMWVTQYRMSVRLTLLLCDAQAHNPN